jgi:membrane protease YdiL (CAAX protease family)
LGTRFIDLTNLGRNGPLRWIGGTLVVLFCWLVVGSFIALPFLLRSNGEMVGGEIFGADPFWLYLATNVSFLGIWLGLWLALKFLHRRGFRTLVTPAPGISWSRIATGFVLWLALVALLQFVEFMLYPARAQYTFQPEEWLFFLPFVLILTPIQTSAEELLFRGYWLQGMGRLTSNVILLIVVNGVLFALPHMFNPEVTRNPESGLLLFFSYATTGAALALFTLRDNRLELALGAHAANNLFAALIVNYADSALQTPAVFTNPTLDAAYAQISLIVIVVAFYFIVFRWLDRRAPVQAEA